MSESTFAIMQALGLDLVVTSVAQNTTTNTTVFKLESLQGDISAKRFVSFDRLLDEKETASLAADLSTEPEQYPQLTEDEAIAEFASHEGTWQSHDFFVEA